MTRFTVLATSTALVFALSATNASAAVVVEAGDAPHLFGSGPQDVGTLGNGDAISGTIDEVQDDADIFKFSLASGGLVSINVVPSDFLNPEIFLFDAFGGGIAFGSANSSSNPLVSTILTAGTYHIGIGDFPLEASDTDGDIWAGGAVPASFGTLSGIHNTSFIDGGDYQISFAITDVTAPATLGLFGLGLAGLAIAARRRLAS